MGICVKTPLTFFSPRNLVPFVICDMGEGGRSKIRHSITWGEGGSNIAIFGEIYFLNPLVI